MCRAVQSLRSRRRCGCGPSVKKVVDGSGGIGMDPLRPKIDRPPHFGTKFCKCSGLSCEDPHRSSCRIRSVLSNWLMFCSGASKSRGSRGQKPKTLQNSAKREGKPLSEKVRGLYANRTAESERQPKGKPLSEI